MAGIINYAIASFKYEYTLQKHQKGSGAQHSRPHFRMDCSDLLSVRACTGPCYHGQARHDVCVLNYKNRIPMADTGYWAPYQHAVTIWQISPSPTDAYLPAA